MFERLNSNDLSKLKAVGNMVKTKNCLNKFYTRVLDEYIRKSIKTLDLKVAKNKDVLRFMNRKIRLIDSKAKTGKFSKFDLVTIHDFKDMLAFRKNKIDRYERLKLESILIELLQISDMKSTKIKIAIGETDKRTKCSKR